jgi:DNA polymerase III subunit alpha
MPEFVHLHNHSHYSILDAISTIDGIIESAVENKMSAVALTDHGVLFGALEFYIKAKEAGIKPIIGSEVYIVTDGSRFDKTKGSKDEESDLAVRNKKTHYKHLVLLAKDKVGWKNLIKLITIGHTEGFYYKPRIDMEVLEKHREGLIALSSCIGGVVSAHLVDGDYEKAREMAKKFKELFGDDFYLEIQNHFMDKELPVLQGMPRLAKELGIKLVATNDCHYIKREHAIPHNIFISIQDKNSVRDIYQLKYGTDQVYFKSADEMYEAFKDYPEALETTLEIAEKCNLEIELGKNYLPHFPIPENAGVKTPEEYLEKLAWEGLQRRYKNITREIEDRLRYELDVIKRMGFSTYFLIVQDFINQARKMGVAVGPGRGSAAGSLVSYALGITNIDPLKYDLLFERFLNPERVSMPDIDVDFADDKRDLVIDYVKRKYGEKSVAQIITFGTLSSRAVIRDVGRVLGISLQTVDSITKNIPVQLGKPLSLKEAIETVPELEWLKTTSDPKLKELIQYSLVLEGLNRHPSTHAAGVVIAPGDISDYVPLYQTPQTELMTQFDKDYLEKTGLLKIDMLGLRTLTVIVNTLKLIKQNYGIEINIDEIPLDDEKTYQLLGEGRTVGVFQFESSGMQEYLRKLKPSNLNDLAVMNALYRPGPMQMIDDYIARKHGEKPVEYLHPKLESILKETFGIVVYQEQVMQIANQIAGFSLAKADLMRRAMGKKDKELMAKQRDEFIEGAVKNGVDRKIAEEIFDMLERFASYGFNKSHAVAYAYIAYQTAYLKAHFPAEFMAATMSSELNNTDKIVQFIDDCRKMGIKVLPPDVNESNLDFTVIDKNTIRFGLGAIKNVGENAVNEIIRARNEGGKFKNIFDFCARVDLRVVNKRAIESLIQAGAFDSLNCGHRAQLLQSVELAINYGEKVKKDRRNGQVGLFDLFTTEFESENYPPLPEVKPWSEMEKLSYERAVLGFYVSGHPLMRYFDDVQTFATVKLGEPESVREGQIVRACGVITDMKTKLDKNKNQMLIFELEDFTGKAECVAFSEVYKNYSRHLTIEGLVMVVGKADVRGNQLYIQVNEVYPLSDVRESFTHKIVIFVDKNEPEEKGRKLAEILKDSDEGNCFIEIDVKDNGSVIQRFEISNLFVKPSGKLLNSLKSLFGEENVKLIPK